MGESQRDAWYRSVATDEDERFAKSFCVASYGCCLLLLLAFLTFALGMIGLGWSMLDA